MNTIGYLSSNSYFEDAGSFHGSEVKIPESRESPKERWWHTVLPYSCPKSVADFTVNSTFPWFLGFCPVTFYCHAPLVIPAMCVNSCRPATFHGSCYLSNPPKSASFCRSIFPYEARFFLAFFPTILLCRFRLVIFKSLMSDSGFSLDPLSAAWTWNCALAWFDGQAWG